MIHYIYSYFFNSKNMEFNPHAHLENPELAKQNQELDEEYNSKNISLEDLNKEKKEAQNIFGNFNPDKVDTANLTPENFNPQYDHILSRWEDLTYLPTEEYISNIKESLNNKDKNFEDFKNDIEDFKEVAELSEYDFAIENNIFESRVLNKIWQNYLKFPDKNWHCDKIKDLETAIITTKNEILRDYVNLPIDSETYKTAIKNINSGDIKKQMQGIDSLYTLAGSKAWELWKTSLDKYKNNRKKELKIEFNKIKTELETLEQKEDKTEEESKKVKALTVEYNSIIKQAEEIDAWDIFESWELDKNTSNSEDIKENK